MGWGRIAFAGVTGAGLVAGLVWALWPQPQPVDLAQVTRGPLQVEILAEGATRVRDPYAITAPITGYAHRAPVAEGDAVIQGETVVAFISPPDPALMDSRSRAQAEAAVTEAQAAVEFAETSLRQAESGLAHAVQQLERGQALADRGTIPVRMLEDLQATHDSAEQAAHAARAQLDLSRATLVRAQAQLLGPTGLYDPERDPTECCLRIVAPRSGVVLSLIDRNARLVQAGSPLLTIGDLDEMEIVIDLLSSDAVRVPEAARALIEGWGGEAVLEARLRRVEPAAFTRVSALGIEEQRVRLRFDLLSPRAERSGLGEGFRVRARVILWHGESVLQVPRAALFREAGDWAVFVNEAGRAQRRVVGIGRQSADMAEVIDGLEEGAEVVLFPPSSLGEGAAITDRAVLR